MVNFYPYNQRGLILNVVNFEGSVACVFIYPFHNPIRLLHVDSLNAHQLYHKYKTDEIKLDSRSIVYESSFFVRKMDISLNKYFCCFFSEEVYS